MPSANTRINKAKINTVNNNKKIITDAVLVSLDDAIKDVYEETYLIFRHCIDQFYSYETTSYYRHGTGRGTRTGINLYEASQFDLIYNNNHIDGISIGWNDENMLPYKKWHWEDENGNEHEEVEAEYVLGLVMNGVRGLEDKYLKKSYASYNNHWSVPEFITTKNLFGKLKGTPNQIFDEIENNWKKVTVEQYKEYFRRFYITIKK